MLAPLDGWIANHAQPLARRTVGPRRKPPASVPSLAPLFFLSVYVIVCSRLAEWRFLFCMLLFHGQGVAVGYESTFYPNGTVVTHEASFSGM